MSVVASGIGQNLRFGRRKTHHCKTNRRRHQFLAQIRRLRKMRGSGIIGRLPEGFRLMPTMFFSPTHDWLRIEDDGLASIGMTEQGLAGLGRISSITLPEAGRPVAKGEACGHLLGDAGAQDIRAPLSGTITDINQTLADAPETLGETPLTAWLFKMRLSDPTAFTELMDQAGYDAFLAKS